MLLALAVELSYLRPGLGTPSLASLKGPALNASPAAVFGLPKSLVYELALNPANTDDYLPLALLSQIS
jgi:hypothetical protein